MFSFHVPIGTPVTHSWRLGFWWLHACHSASGTPVPRLMGFNGFYTRKTRGNSASKTHGKVICGDGISWNPCWNTMLCHKKIMVSLMAQWNKYLIWAQNRNRTVWFWHCSYERYWSRVAQQMIFSAEAAKVNPLDLDPNLFFMNEWWMFHEYVLIYSRDIKTHMDKHIGAELIIKKNVMIATQNGFHQQSAMSFVQVCNTIPHDLFGLCADVVISIMVTFRWDIPQGIPLQQLWSICIYIYIRIYICLTDYPTAWWLLPFCSTWHDGRRSTDLHICSDGLNPPTRQSNKILPYSLRLTVTNPLDYSLNAYA